MKVYKGKKRFFIYDSDTSLYGSFKIKHQHPKYKQWELYAGYGIGYNGAPIPSSSIGVKMKGNTSGIGNAGINLYLSNHINIGVAYSQTSLSCLYGGDNKFIVADLIRYYAVLSTYRFYIKKIEVNAGVSAAHFVSNQLPSPFKFNYGDGLRGYSFGLPVFIKYPIIGNIYAISALSYNYDWSLKQNMAFYGWVDANEKISRLSAILGLSFRF